MTTTRLVIGLAIGCAAVTLITIAARRARRRLVPAWAGPEAILADAILVLSLLTIVSDLLGAAGWFGPWPVLSGLLIVSSALWWWGDPPRRHEVTSVGAACSDSTVTDAHQPASPQRNWTVYAVAGGVMAVAAVWISELPFVYRNGIYDWDSLWYHLPAAATFVHTGQFLPLKLYDANIVVSTYPAGADVFHALGMIATGSDILSPILNIGWAALFLLAMHVFGRRFHVAHLATVAGLTILAFPMVIQLEAVSALSEMMAIACLASALAFIVTKPKKTQRLEIDEYPGDATTVTRRRSLVGPAVLTGFAVGLMASTKLVMLAPAMILFAGVLVIQLLRGKRELRTTLVPFSVATVATGSFWYVRNIIQFGNPVPALHLGLGEIALPSVHQSGQFVPMLPTLIDGIGSGGTLTAMAQTFGPLWSLFLILLPLGTVTIAVVQRRSREVVAFALIGLAMLLAGYFTPQYALDGTYLNLFANGRYLLAGIITTSLATTAIIGQSQTWRKRGLIAALGIFIWTLLGYLTRPFRNVWFGAYPISGPWALLIICLFGSLLLGYALTRSARSRAILTKSGLACALVVSLALLVVVQPSYLSDRYRPEPESAAVYDWAQSHENRVIGVEPFDYAEFSQLRHEQIAWIQRKYALIIAYPLYGRNGSNTVEPIARFNGDRVVRPSTCTQWWDDLDRMEATNVVVWSSGPTRPMSKYERWTTRSRSATRLAAQPVGRRPGARLVLYRVDHNRPPC